MANSWIKYSSHAKRDFIGGIEHVDDDSWNRVQGLIYYASTYGLAGSNNPFPSWEVNITCGDWQNRCKSGVQAYATNPVSRRGDIPGIYMDTITFCPDTLFFENGSRIDSCYKRRTVGDKNRNYNLLDYQCWGWVVLHELFHLNSLSDRVNTPSTFGTGHVFDLWVEYQEMGQNGTRKVAAYGPEITKILANYMVGPLAGRLTSINADNLAQFALSLWVEYTSKWSLYPAAPRVTATPVGNGKLNSYAFAPDGTLLLNTTAINEGLPYPIPTYLATDNVCDDVSDTDGCYILSTSGAGSAINISISDPITFAGTGGFAGDPPFGNISQWPTNDTVDLTPGEGPPQLSADPSFFCYAGQPEDIIWQPSVTQAFAQASIATFCNITAGKALDPNNTVALPLPFVPPDDTTDLLLWFQASWQLGDPSCQGAGRLPSTEECNEQLSYILNSCDTSSITNKYGGTHINECIDWSMWVNATIPTPQQMSCEYDPEEQTCGCSDGIHPATTVDLDPAGGCSLLYN